MGITVYHPKTATTPDVTNTAATNYGDVKPSDWNSAHAVSVSLAGSEVIKYIAAGGNSQSSGTIQFSNSNGMSFGLNNGTITASHNGLTTQSVQTQGIQSISAGGNQVTGGQVVFSNSNGLAFGVNGSTITGSYTVPTQSAQSVGVYASSQTTGASSSSTVDARSLSIVGAGGVSVGLTNGSVVISGATGGGGGANSFNILAAGTQTAGTATTVQFANSNGITFGMSGSAQITASHNGLTSQSNQAISAANGSSTFQTISFGDSNGVSWSLSNGSVVASVAAGGGTLSVYAGSNTTNASSSTLPASSFQVAGAGNISAGFSNGSLVISGASGAAQTITQYATGNTAGDASTGAQALSSIVVRGAGIASVGYSNDGALIVSVPAGGGGGDGANFLAAGTQTATTLGTVAFVNSNGLTFGMSGSTQITASHNGLTTAAASNHSHGNPTLNLTNLSGTTASASNGLTLSLSAASQTAQTVGVYGVSNTTGASSSSTVDARSLSFQGAGGVSVGLTNGSVVISGAAGGGAAVTASAANGSYTVGNLSFSNANGISFGTSAGSAITASHNALTTAAASNHSHGNPTLALTNLSGTTASASNGLTLSLSANAPGAATLTVSAVGNTTVNSSGTWPGAVSIRGYGVLSVGTSNGSLLLSTPDAVDFTQLSVGVSTGGNTAGDTGLFTGRMVLAGGANITLSGSSNGGSVTMSIVGAAGGGGGVAISGGTQLATSGTVVFSNSNNLTFGLSGSTRMTMSGALNLYGLGNTTQNSSTVLGLAAISLNGLGGMTVGYSNGSVQLSAPAVSSLSATGAVSIVTNGSTVSIGVPNLSIYASSNTTAQSSSSSVSLGSLTVRGAGGVSVGMSAGELVISGGAGGGAAVTASAANGSYTVGNLSFSNANGVTFATSAGSAIVASVNTSYAASNHSHGNPTLNLTNLSGTTASASNGFTLSLSASIQTLGLYATGNTTQNSSTTFDARTLGTMNGLGAMTVGFSNGSIQLSAPATSSLSATGILSISTNGSTISIGVPGGTVSFWNPFDNPQTTASQIGNGSVLVQPAHNLHGNVSISRLDVFASMSISSSTNSSHAGALSFNVGFYTRTGSTLSLATSASQSYQWTNTSNNSVASLDGLRRFSVPLGANLADGSDYWIAVQSRSSTTNANWFTASNMRVTVATGQITGLIGEASNASKQIAPGFGLWSTTSTALPASIAFSDLRGIGSGAANNALPVFINANNFTA